MALLPANPIQPDPPKSILDRIADLIPRSLTELTLVLAVLAIAVYMWLALTTTVISVNPFACTYEAAASPDAGKTTPGTTPSTPKTPPAPLSKGAKTTPGPPLDKAKAQPQSSTDKARTQPSTSTDTAKGQQTPTPGSGTPSPPPPGDAAKAQAEQLTNDFKDSLRLTDTMLREFLTASGHDFYAKDPRMPPNWAPETGAKYLQDCCSMLPELPQLPDIVTTGEAKGIAGAVQFLASALGKSVKISGNAVGPTAGKTYEVRVTVERSASPAEAVWAEGDKEDVTGVAAAGAYLSLQQSHGELRQLVASPEALWHIVEGLHCWLEAEHDATREDSKLADARSLFLKATQEAPYQSLPYLCQGMVFGRLESRCASGSPEAADYHDRAREAFLRAIVHCPASQARWLSRMYHQLGALDQGSADEQTKIRVLRVLYESVRLDPSNTIAWNLIGDQEGALGVRHPSGWTRHFSCALRAYQKAGTSAALAPLGWTGLGWAMAWRAEVSPAGQDVEYLRQALAEATAGAVRPSAPVTLSREAVDYALKLARIDPRSAAAYHRMAEALLPRLSGPTVSLTQAPGTDLWQRLGSYSAQMGMMDEALGWFRSCAEEEEAQGNAPQCLGAWAVSKSKRGACLAAVLVAGTDAERLSAVIAEPNGMGYMDWITALAVLDLAPKRLDDDRRVRWDSVLLSCMGRDRPAFPDDRRVSITWLDLYKHLAHASSDERLVSAYSAYLQGDPPLRRAVEMLVSAHEQSAKGALLWPDAYTWGAMQSPQDVLKDLGKLLGERGPDLIEAARKASEDTSCRQCESCDPTGLPRGR